MVARRGKLDLDESLFEGDRRRREPKPAREPFMRGDRTEKALIVACVLAVLVLVLVALETKTENWVALVLLGLVFAASELFGLKAKAGGRLTLALFPVVIAMMTSGPLAATLVPLFGIPVFIYEMGDEGPRRVVFNTAQYVFAAGAAALVFKHIGGALLKPELQNAGKLVLPWILATIVFYVFNTALVTPPLSEQKGEKMVRFWERRLLIKLPGYFLYSAIAFLGAIAYVKLQFPGVVLLVTPLLAIRVVYTRYGTMRDVCDDTTLAVMKAVEGGGMFTEGHSVAVAEMAEAIAEEMNFAEEDLHYLRQAALLHDVGKLALNPSLVNKPGMLSQEDYEEIQKHPLIGGSIVAREESFALVAPAITHHHELTDGSGYVDGLAGETIPLPARILAVADAYDAMQRPSEYREPLSTYDAASEVVRSKGIQFDPEVVDAFISVVKRKGIWAGALREPVRMPERAVEEQATLPEQPSLESSATVEPQHPLTPSSTPADGLAYAEVMDEIEKDIRDWERSDVDRSRRRGRGEQRKKTSGLKRKKQEDKRK